MPPLHSGIVLASPLGELDREPRSEDRFEPGGSKKPPRAEPLFTAYDDGGLSLSWDDHQFRLPEPLRTLDRDPDGRYETLERGLTARRKTEDRPEGAPYVPFATASKAEREEVFKWRPILEDHDGFRLLTQYFLHAGFRADNGGHLANWKMVFRQFGYALYRSGNKPNARTLLWAYKLLVDKDLTWSKPHSNERARTITEHGIPRSVRVLRDMYVREPEDFESVFFQNGNQANRTAKRRLQEGQEDFETEDPVVDPPEDTRRLKTYLEGRSSRLFTPLSNQVPKVRRQIKKGTVEIPYQERNRIFEALKHIEDSPKPKYAVSDWSPRLRSPGKNRLVGLDTSVRKALYTDHHVELDLSKAHAAIAAEDWGGLENLRSWLENHLQKETFDFWEALATTVLNTGAEPPQSDQEAAKIAVKKGLYTLVYGGKESNILFQMSKAYGDEVGIKAPETDKFRSFLTHPMIKDLLEAREKKLNEIRENGGMKDCYGRFISVEKFEKRPNRDNPARGVLAYCAQARELFLLRPILDLAEKEEKAVQRGKKTRSEFQILLYQYDGVTIQVRRKSRREAVVKKLQNAVDDHAKKHGYRTALEVDRKPPDMS